MFTFFGHHTPAEIGIIIAALQHSCNIESADIYTLEVLGGKISLGIDDIDTHDRTDKMDGVIIGVKWAINHLQDYVQEVPPEYRKN